MAILIATLSACRDTPVPTALPLAERPLLQLATAPVVNTLTDYNDEEDPGCTDAECTLREAIAFASTGATITFSPNLDVWYPSGIILGQGELVIDKDLTIVGPGTSLLSITGNHSSRVLAVTTGATVSISGLTLRDGSVYGASGGVIHNAGTLSLTQSVVSGGYTGWTYCGGGIYNSGTLSVTEVSVSGNGGGSGAGLCNYGTMTVTRSAVTGNMASGGGTGGGIYSSTSTDLVSTSTTIINSTISGNTGDMGGGIRNANGLTRIIASTVTANHAMSMWRSGGVLSLNSATSQTIVKSSIIWGNTAGYDRDPDDVGASGTTTRYASLGYNLIGARGLNVDFTQEFNQAGDQTNVADALLGALALNSPGTTLTHELQAGSPAINAGACTDHAGATISTDQRGLARPQGSACDVGAYEVLITTITVTIDIAPDNAVNRLKTKAKGLIPVAVFGSSTFDVGTIALSTLRFGPNAASPVHDLSDPLILAAHLTDLNLDGYTDLVLHFKAADAGFTMASTQGCVTGQTASATDVEGCDAVVMVNK